MSTRKRTPKYDIILQKLSEEDYEKLCKIIRKVPKPVKYLQDKFKISYPTAKSFYREHFTFKVRIAGEESPEKAVVPVIDGGERQYYDTFYQNQRLLFYTKYKSYTEDVLHNLFNELLLRDEDLRLIFRCLTGRQATTNRYGYLYDGVRGAIYGNDPEMVDLCTTDKPRQRLIDTNDTPGNSEKKRVGRPRTRPTGPHRVEIVLDGEPIVIERVYA